jgi:hypothetical protein
MAIIQYRTIRFVVDRRNAIVRKQFKLPMNLKVCTGYLVKVLHGMHTGDDQKEVGLISLEFNSKKELAVNEVIGFEQFTEVKYEFQILEVELERSGVVNCVYIDKFPSNLNFSPYTVSVYLKCSTVANNQVACSI